MEVGTAYAIFSALGTALMASVGILWFNEPATVLKIISLVMIVVGVVGLNLNFGLARN
jgi:small multidrug resistance pump